MKHIKFRPIDFMVYRDMYDELWYKDGIFCTIDRSNYTLVEEESPSNFYVTTSVMYGHYGRKIFIFHELMMFVGDIFCESREV